MTTSRVPTEPMPTRPSTPVQAHAHPYPPPPKPSSGEQSQDAEKAKEGASTGDLGGSAP